MKIRNVKYFMAFAGAFQR